MARAARSVDEVEGLDAFDHDIRLALNDVELMSALMQEFTEAGEDQMALEVVGRVGELGRPTAEMYWALLESSDATVALKSARALWTIVDRDKIRSAYPLLAEWPEADPEVDPRVAVAAERLYELGDQHGALGAYLRVALAGGSDACQLLLERLEQTTPGAVRGRPPALYLTPAFTPEPAG